MKVQKIVGLVLFSLLLLLVWGSSETYGRERKTRKQQQPARLDKPWTFSDLFKLNNIVGNRFAVHDRGLQCLLMANHGELSNPDNRPADPSRTPYAEGSSVRNSRLNYPGCDTNTGFLFSGGLWVGAIKAGERIVSTVTDGDNGTREFGPLSSWLSQSTETASKENDDDNDWTRANDRDGDGAPSNDYDGPNADANGDGVFNYDPEPGIDEDPVGDISRDFLDNDNDGLIDEADPDKDGDKVPGSRDDDGDGKLDEDTLARAQQEWYTAYVDTCRTCLDSPDPDGFSPLGVRVVQHSYQWSEQFRDDFMIFEFFVTNIGNDILKDVWLGTFFDFDVDTPEQGTAGSEDDITFYIDSLQTAIGGDDDGAELDAQFFGIRVLKVPRPNVNLSYLNFERISGGDPNDNVEKYVKMSSGVRDPDQFNVGDWRFVFSFGPLGDLAPGHTLPVTLAIINGGKKGLSRNENIALIAQNSRQALALFQNDFRGPAAPDAPTFALEPLERAVKITWDGDRSERSVDPIAKKLDFEGYRIWRSFDGLNFTQVADFDLVNGIGYDRGMPSKNTDGKYEFIDKGLPALVQIKYVVTAFDNGDNGDEINHPEADRASGGIGVLESSLGAARQKIAVPSSGVSASLDNIYTVPNPYVGSSEFEQFGRFDALGNRTFPKTIQFVNLPAQAKIQIFTLAGDLVRELNHDNGSGVELWDLRTRLEQEAVAGIYLYRVEANGQQKIGKLLVIK
jgi:hypothetical protein